MKVSTLPQKARSYARSLLSRYVFAWGQSNRVPPDIKHIRKQSCLGDEEDLAPCPHRVPSQKFANSYFCDACGCGDRPGVLLDGQTPRYEKLDYPYVTCPLQMPGFSNYVASAVAQDEANNYRKAYLETHHDRAYLEQVAKKQQEFLSIFKRRKQFFKKLLGRTP